MGVVMIKCPGTGQAISTGMKADRERFRSSPVFFARTFCSICQANHVCPGGLGSRAGREMAYARGRIRPGTGVAVEALQSGQWPRGRWPVAPCAGARRRASSALANRGTSAPGGCGSISSIRMIRSILRRISW